MAGVTPTSAARPGQPRAPRSATCRRSRSSIPTKDVLGNVEEAVAETARPARPASTRSTPRFGEDLSPDEMDKLLAEQGRLQDAHRRGQRLGARPHPRDRHGRPAPAAGGRRRHQALGRRAPPRRPLPPAARSAPTCCCSTSPPTTSTPRRSPGSSATCRSTPGTVVAVTHDRYFLDNVAGWILELDRGAGHSLEGQLLLLAGAEEEPPRSRRRRPSRPASAPWSASWSGCAWRPAPARPRARPA